jgi:hypothetical protein
VTVELITSAMKRSCKHLSPRDHRGRATEVFEMDAAKSRFEAISGK